MNVDALNKWLILIANIGVVAGIIFLAVEIRQNQISLDRNSALMEREYLLEVADSLKAIADANDKFRLLTAGDAELAKIWLDGVAGKDLSEVDEYRFEQMCGILIWNSATIYRRMSALDQVDFVEAEERMTRTQIDTSPGMQKCWEANTYALRLWGFDDLVDGVATAEPL